MYRNNEKGFSKRQNSCCSVSLAGLIEVEQQVTGTMFGFLSSESDRRGQGQVFEMPIFTYRGRGQERPITSHSRDPQTVLRVNFPEADFLIVKVASPDC